MRTSLKRRFVSTRLRNRPFRNGAMIVGGESHPPEVILREVRLSKIDNPP
jgi:hypothetical protein